MTAHDRARRQLLQFLAGSPLLPSLSVVAAALQQQPAVPIDDLITSPDQALNVFDFEPVMRQRLPPAHLAYLETGTDSDGTIKANREGFNRFQLRVRRLVDVRQIDMSVNLFGTSAPTP